MSHDLEPAEDWSWATDQAGAAPEIDTTKPSIARIYDAALGGKDNYAVDRAVLEEMVKVFPESMEAGRINRDFLIRGIRYMTRQGIDQFLDLGSGLPTVQNTHEVAQEVNPEARVLYVDNDPIVLAHGRAILARDRRTRVIAADFLDPEGVLHHPDTKGFLDFSRPVGLVMLAVIHHVLDEENPREVIAAYRDHLVPGSYFILSHVTDAFPEAAAAHEILVKALGRGQLRGREEITAFFDGFTILPPGIGPLPHWRPDTPVKEPLSPAELLALGGMGIKP